MRRGWQLYNTVSVPNSTESFTLKWFILCYMNFTSIKTFNKGEMLKQKKKERERSLDNRLAQGKKQHCPSIQVILKSNVSGHSFIHQYFVRTFFGPDLGI